MTYGIEVSSIHGTSNLSTKLSKMNAEPPELHLSVLTVDIFCLNETGGEDRSTANLGRPADSLRSLRGGPHRQEAQASARPLASPERGSYWEEIQVRPVTLFQLHPSPKIWFSHPTLHSWSTFFAGWATNKLCSSSRAMPTKWRIGSPRSYSSLPKRATRYHWLIYDYFSWYGNYLDKFSWCPGFY